MAGLTGETVASSYVKLLTLVDGAITSSPQVIEDGLGGDTSLSLSNTGVTSTGTLTVDGVSTLTGAVTATAGLDGIIGGVTPAAVTGTTIIGTTIDGVIGSVTPAAITGTTIGGTVITASTNFAGDITGDLTGNADTSTKVYVTDNESTDEENLVSFVADAAVASGNHGLEMDGNLTYNPSTGTLTTTAVASALTGDVTGDVTGDLTGEVTATGTLADGVTATTQTAADDSTKVATTAYADAAGTVLQVVYFDTDDATFTTAATASMVSIAGDTHTLEAAITPAHKDNYILIQIMITFGPNYGVRAGFGISRDNPSAQIGSSTVGTGSQRDAITAPMFNNGHDINVHSTANVYVQYRDSLSSWTDGEITYTATVNSDGGLYLNRPYTVSDSTNVVYGRSSITLTEIKG